MDTVLIAAALAFGTEFFKYLNSPQGQVFAAQQNQANAKFNTQIGELFDKVHGFILQIATPADTPKS